jgi:hypothetical protein
MLLFPGLADRAARPLVALGVRLADSAGQDGVAARVPLLPSLLLGVATGRLWAPCAGPILGLILTGAALRGANAETSLLLLTFAVGAATSLALSRSGRFSRKPTQFVWNRPLPVKPTRSTSKGNPSPLYPAGTYTSTTRTDGSPSILSLRAWLSTVMRLTEPIGPKNLRMCAPLAYCVLPLAYIVWLVS